MTTTVELTPALTSMRVLAVTKEAVYVRLPEALRRVAGDTPCSCDVCKGETPGLWDTLVIPTVPTKKRGYFDEHTYTVHMPDASVQGFREYWKGKGKLVR